MQKNLTCIHHAVLCVLCMVMLWGNACKKGGALPPDGALADSAASSDSLVAKALALAGNGALAFLGGQQSRWGRLDWSRAVGAKNPTELICLVPYLDSQGTDVAALAIVSISDSVKIKITPAGLSQAPGARQGEPDKGQMLANYFRYRYFGKQPASASGIRFVPRQEGDQAANTQANARAVAYVVSVCYDVVVCTGDGYGGCAGNYRYYSECVSSTYWLHEFDYAGPRGGYPDADLGGGAGGGGTTGSARTYLLPPTDPISDIGQYLKCFDRNQPGRLVIYVDQPQAGSDEPFTILGKMGHVFCCLEQTQLTGTVRRFFGFHAASKVDPFGNKSAGSRLASDQGRSYDLFLPIALSPGQMEQVLDAVAGHGPVYDLEDYNCTHFAIDVAAAAGTQLPRSPGWWIFGSGLNPGRFGQDLRTITGTVDHRGRAGRNAGSCN